MKTSLFVLRCSLRDRVDQPDYYAVDYSVKHRYYERCRLYAKNRISCCWKVKCAVDLGTRWQFSIR